MTLQNEGESSGELVEQRSLSRLGFLFNGLIGVICLIYLMNPSIGVVEPLPDALPIVGNLDEGMATLILLTTLRNVGIDLSGILSVKKNPQ